MKEGTKYTTKESIMQRAQELVDARIPFGVLDISGRLSEKTKVIWGKSLRKAGMSIIDCEP